MLTYQSTSHEGASCRTSPSPPPRARTSSSAPARSAPRSPCSSPRPDSTSWWSRAAAAGRSTPASDGSPPTRRASTPCSPPQPDAAVIYNCVNPPYDRWVELWPPMAQAFLDYAERTGAVLATCSNLYGYGPVDVPMTEDLPLAATGDEGPGAHHDVAGGQGGERCRPHPCHRGARVGLHLPRSAEHARRSRDPAHPGRHATSSCSATSTSRTRGRHPSTSPAPSSPSPPTRAAGVARGMCRATRRAPSARPSATSPPRQGCRRSRPRRCRACSSRSWDCSSRSCASSRRPTTSASVPTCSTTRPPARRSAIEPTPWAELLDGMVAHYRPVAQAAA